VAERAEAAGAAGARPSSLPAEESAPEGARTEEPGSLASLVERVARVFEIIVAPLGVVTGFLFFFGWTYSGAYYGYFGIDQRLLQYSMQDQLLLSAQPMFGTAVILLTVAGALWVSDHASAGLRRRRGRLAAVARRTTLCLALLGGGIGLSSALGLRPFPGLLSARTTALMMLAGLLVLMRIRWSRRPASEARRTERVLIVAAMTVAVFWVASVYATDAGRELARYTDGTPARLPLVTLFTERYIDLPGSSVVVTPQRSPGGTPLYRYTGLRLLTYSNDRWFLITGSYSGYRSTVTVVRDDPDLRPEIAHQR
jgi:hypothetical protein